MSEDTKVQEFIAKIMRIEKLLGSKYQYVIGYKKQSFPPEETEENLIDVDVPFFPINDKSYWFISIRFQT